MSKKGESPSQLVSAAAQLYEQLTRFEQSVTAFAKLPLSSKKQLERAATALQELAAEEQDFGSAIQLLVQAIADSRDRQIAQVDRVRAKALEVQSRSQAFKSLIERFDGLGVAASTLNQKMQGSVSSPEADAAGRFIDLQAEMGALVSQAEGLTTLAREQSFDDVAHLADGLRQQIAAARARLEKADPHLPT